MSELEKRLEAEAQEEARKDDLLSVLSHEVERLVEAMHAMAKTVESFGERLDARLSAFDARLHHLERDKWTGPTGGGGKPTNGGAPP